jgi:hypothetical protein
VACRRGDFQFRTAGTATAFRAGGMRHTITD